MRIFADSTANRVTCTTIDARGSATKTYNGAGALVPGAVGVGAQGAALRVRYLIVFGQQ